MMTTFGRYSALVGAALVAAIMSIAAPASAQATRTWVSGVGDDANPCSRTAPCKTFAGAISKTAATGEINCLDPGGYGAVTITKAMTIRCEYTEGGITNAGTNGVVVNAGASDAVYLSGLDIMGSGTGINGVRFLAGASLTIENSLIRNSGTGVSFQPSAASQLVIINTTIASNGSGTTGGGILIQPTGAGGSAKVVLDGVRIVNNAGVGLKIDTTGNTNVAGVVATMTNSEVSMGAQGIRVVTPPSTTTAALMLVDSTVAGNTGTGILGNGATATVRVGNTTITGNATGVNAANGSTVKSFGNNSLAGNTADGAFALPNLAPQ